MNWDIFLFCSLLSFPFFPFLFFSYLLFCFLYFSFPFFPYLKSFLFRFALFFFGPFMFEVNLKSEERRMVKINYSYEKKFYVNLGIEPVTHGLTHGIIHGIEIKDRDWTDAEGRSTIGRIPFVPVFALFSC